MTSQPALAMSAAQAMPAGPEPTMPTLKSVGSMYGMLAQPSRDRVVADEALQPADRDRLQRFADGADAFALVLLRADAAADRRQQVGVGEDVVGAAEILLADLLDEARDVDADRAAARRRAGRGTSGSARLRAARPRAL